MSLDVEAQNRVDAGLVPSALAPKPLHDVTVQTDRDGLLGLRKNDLCAAKPRRVQFRRRVRIGTDSATDIRVAECVNAVPVRFARGGATPSRSRDSTLRARPFLLF